MSCSAIPVMSTPRITDPRDWLVIALIFVAVLAVVVVIGIRKFLVVTLIAPLVFVGWIFVAAVLLGERRLQQQPHSS